jgi:signal transduction histidine kinase/ligand-binding sensor domain-containing protein
MWRRIITFGVAALVPATLAALDPSLRLTQYAHMGWVRDEGHSLPAVTAISQTSFGYLWIGTSNGLYRFDGVHFVAWNQQLWSTGEDMAVRALAASRDGELWVATRYGVSRLDASGRVADLAGGSRIQIAGVSNLLVDHSGNLWIGARAPNPLRVLTAAGLKNYGPGDGLRGDVVLSIFETRGRHIWVGTNAGLCESVGFSAPFSCKTGPSAETVSFDESDNGDLWAAGNNGLFRLTHAGWTPVLRDFQGFVLAARVMLRDRRDNIWLGTLGQGLLRIGGGEMQSFTRKDGLSSDVVECAFEDREGNLWLGTAFGLDRFSDPRIARVTTIEGLSGDLVTAVLGSREGDVWVGTSGKGLDRLSATGKITHYQLSAGLPATTILSLYQDRAGTVWAGTTGGVGRFLGGRFAPVRGGGWDRLTRVSIITGDSPGALFLADARAGLVTVRGGAPVPLATPFESEEISALYADRDGTLWIGGRAGDLAVRRGDQFSEVRLPRRVPGPVGEIHQDANGNIWAAYRDTVLRLHGETWAEWPAEVRQMIDDSEGNLWLEIPSAFLKIPKAQLDTVQSFSASSGIVRCSFADALRIGEGGLSHPRWTRAQDGKLWIATQDGAAYFDPRGFGPTPVPVASIDGFQVDHKPWDLSRPLRFRGREVLISYAGLRLADSEGARFRYSLDGLDRAWVDSGAERQVQYVNLDPGTYRFRVSASNAEGFWSDPAAVSFEVRPSFYQTTWFLTLCAALLGASVWGMIRIRARSLRTHFQIVLDERTRMAREIHDTLLQGFTGVVFQLEAARRQLDRAPDLARRRVEHALDEADRSLREARHSVTFMRVPGLEGQSLEAAISGAANRLTADRGISFQVNVSGRPYGLRYNTQWNFYVIAREAIANAVEHGRPSRIVIFLAYFPDHVDLCIEDDGAGFDPQAIPASRDPHFGISGMRERTHGLKGTVTILSAPGSGSKVRISIPATPLIEER